MTIRVMVKAAAAGLALTQLASAQLYSACNPTKEPVGHCPPNPALGSTTLNVDFTNGASSDFSLASGNITYDPQMGAVLTIKSEDDYPTLVSEKYIMYGRIDVVVQAAPGSGIVTAITLQSEDLDEIDVEWVGYDHSNVQTNYFSQGITGNYDRGTFEAVNGDVFSSFHTYSLDWTETSLKWLVDGNVVRTLVRNNNVKGAYRYPQTPSRVRVGTWVAGKPSQSSGTISWSGGLADFSKGPFLAYVKSITMNDYSKGVPNAKEYLWTDQSGTDDSIKVITANSISSSSSSSVGSQTSLTTSSISSTTLISTGNATKGETTNSATVIVSSTSTATNNNGDAFTTVIPITVTVPCDSSGVPITTELEPTPSTTTLTATNVMNSSTFVISHNVTSTAPNGVPLTTTLDLPTTAPRDNNSVPITTFPAVIAPVISSSQATFTTGNASDSTPSTTVGATTVVELPGTTFTASGINSSTIIVVPSTTMQTVSSSIIKSVVDVTVTVPSDQTGAPITSATSTEPATTSVVQLPGTTFTVSDVVSSTTMVVPSTTVITAPNGQVSTSTLQLTVTVPCDENGAPITSFPANNAPEVTASTTIVQLPGTTFTVSNAISSTTVVVPSTTVTTAPNGQVSTSTVQLTVTVPCDGNGALITSSPVNGTTGVLESTTVVQLPGTTFTVSDAISSTTVVVPSTTVTTAPNGQVSSSTLQLTFTVPLDRNGSLTTSSHFNNATEIPASTTVVELPGTTFTVSNVVSSTTVVVPSTSVSTAPNGQVSTTTIQVTATVPCDSTGAPITSAASNVPQPLTTTDSVPMGSTTVVELPGTTFTATGVTSSTTVVVPSTTITTTTNGVVITSTVRVTLTVPCNKNGSPMTTAPGSPATTATAVPTEAIAPVPTPSASTAPGTTESTTLLTATSVTSQDGSAASSLSTGGTPELTTIETLQPTSVATAPYSNDSGNTTLRTAPSGTGSSMPAASETSVFVGLASTTTTDTFFAGAVALVAAVALLV